MAGGSVVPSSSESKKEEAPAALPQPTPLSAEIKRAVKEGRDLVVQELLGNDGGVDDGGAGAAGTPAGTAAERTAGNGSGVSESDAKALSAQLLQGLEHADNVEASLKAIGDDINSLDMLVLPVLQENAQRLEELFDALDTLESDVLPQVDETLDAFESSVAELEARQGELAPSSYQKMKESFYSGWSSFSASATQSGALKPPDHHDVAGEPIDGAAKGGRGGGAAGEASVVEEPRWQAPPVFDTSEILAAAEQRESRRREETAGDGGDVQNSGFTTVAPPPAPSGGTTGYSSYLSGMSMSGMSGMSGMSMSGMSAKMPSVGSLGSMKLSVSMEDMSKSLGYGQRGKKQMDDNVTSLDQEIIVSEEHYGRDRPEAGPTAATDAADAADAAGSTGASASAAANASSTREGPPASPTDRKPKAKSNSEPVDAVGWSPARAAALGSHERAKEGVESVDQRAAVYTNETARALEYPPDDSPTGEEEDEEEDLVEL